jgi:hypothetical protein
LGSTGIDAIRHPGADDYNADHDPADVTTGQADHPDPDQPDRNDAVNADKPDDDAHDTHDTDNTDDPDADRKPNDTEPNALGDPLDPGDADPGRDDPHGDATDPVSRFGGRL